MALTAFRWVALAVTGALIASVVIMRDGAEFGWRRYAAAPTLERRDRARGHVEAAAARLRQIELRDSVARAVPAPRTQGIRLVVSPALAGQKALFEGIFAATTSGIGTTGIPVDVVVVPDTGRTIAAGMSLGGRTQPVYFLPDASIGNRCLVVMRYQPPAASTSQRTIAARRLVTQMRSRRLLGPCAFYAEFGAPGPQVRRWLDRHRWTVAYSADWTRAPELFRDIGGPTSLQLLFDPQWDSRLRAVTSPEGFRCASGDVEECERVMVEGLPPRVMLVRLGTAWGNVLDPLTYGVRMGWFSRYETFGPAQETVLSEMVRTLGAERFRLFWQSREAPAAAFRAAAGEDLGAWVHEWSGRVYGDVVRGPGVPLRMLAWALLFTALAVAVAMRAATSRSVR